MVWSLGVGWVRDGHRWEAAGVDLDLATLLHSLSTSPSLPFLCSNPNF